jgi:DNA-binding transcriptional regulator GbsR (MarR family)
MNNLRAEGGGESHGDSLDPRVMEVCDAIGHFIEYWGFKSIHGRVWAILALHRDPLPQIQVANILGVSRSLVSGVISDLAERGLVRAIDERRNAPYVAVTEFWPTVAAVLRSREWMLIERTRQALEGLVVEGDRQAARGRTTRYNIGRARNLLRLTESGQSVLKLVIGFPAGSGVERVSNWLRHVTGLARKLRG